MTKVTYLDHSGFMVNTGKTLLVFDYYRDPAHKVVKALEDNPDMPVVFFVSHRHPDHFSHEIFNLGQSHERRYVMSNDIFSKEVHSDLPVNWMSHGDIVEGLPGDMTVKAYGIHGKGVSYLVKTDAGETIFHAGDLCVDSAKKTPDPKELKQQNEQYRIVVNQIAEDYPKVDLAMLPVDIEDNADYAQDAVYFLQKVATGSFIPFHVDDPQAKACDFKSYPFTQQVQTRLLCLTKPGESVDI